jgi:hypothetical protein
MRHVVTDSSCTSFENKTARAWHYGFIDNRNSGRSGAVTTGSRPGIAWWEVNEWEIVRRSIVRQAIWLSCAHLKQKTKESTCGLTKAYISDTVSLSATYNSRSKFRIFYFGFTHECRVISYAKHFSAWNRNLYLFFFNAGLLNDFFNCSYYTASNYRKKWMYFEF